MYRLSRCALAWQPSCRIGQPERVETSEETELAQVEWIVHIDLLGVVPLEDFELRVRAYPLLMQWTMVLHVSR